MAKPKIFLDTTKVEEVLTWKKRLPIEGVTTNQAIMEKEGVSPNEVEKTIREICRVMPGKPVSIELLDSERSNDELVREALHYAKMNSNIVVKVPTIAEGRHLELIKTLTTKGIKVNSTLNMTTEQLVMAALAGAKYVSLFFNRLKDAGGDPKLEIGRMAQIIDKRNLATKIIVGSIRNPSDITEAMEAGADIVTIPPKVLYAALFHPKSEETRREFDEKGRNFLQTLKRFSQV